jgi:hypothetical protein
LIAVAGLVERPLERDRGRVAQQRARCEIDRPFGSLGKRHLEDDPPGIGLKLVILRPLAAGLEEELEDVSLPERVVAFRSK